MQVHIPPTQAWPLPHSGPLPQVQVPAVQESALVASHATQLTPFTPHFASVGIAHVVPVQQPAAQDAVSQTQAPPTHASPAPHGGPLPHSQAPLAEHPSAFVASQATHALPPEPHAFSDRPLHVGPEQHPLAHICVQPEQAPALQLCPAGQLAHAAPPLPHVPALSPDWHALPAQHPGHEAGSHTHAPLRHSWPAAHAGPEPQVHAPDDEHPSAVAGSHAPHAAPGAPHVLGDSVVHTPPLQQPPGQDVASHAHAP